MEADPGPTASGATGPDSGGHRRRAARRHADLLRTQHDGERSQGRAARSERAFPARGGCSRPSLPRAPASPRWRNAAARDRAVPRAREALDSQIVVLRKQIASEDEAQALAGQIAAEARAQVAEGGAGAERAVFRQNFVQKTRSWRWSVRRRIRGALGKSTARSLPRRDSAPRAGAARAGAENAYVQSAPDELQGDRTRLFDLEERRGPSKDASDRQRIAARSRGGGGPARFSRGAVIGPREVLMEIVPEGQNARRRGAHPALRSTTTCARGSGRPSSTAVTGLQAAHHAPGGVIASTTCPPHACWTPRPRRLRCAR